MEIDPYKVLGLARNASQQEIKAAYRAAARKYHPDAGGDAWVFQQVRQAFEMLSGDADASELQLAPRAAQSTPPPSPRSSTIDVKTPLRRTGILKSMISSHLPLQNETSYFILANVLDIVLTNMLLRNHAIEANPFAAFFLERWGFNGMIAFKMLLVAFICILAQVIALRNMRYAQFVLIAGIVIVGGVVAYSAILFFQLTSVPAS